MDEGHYACFTKDLPNLLDGFVAIAVMVAVKFASPLIVEPTASGRLHFPQVIKFRQFP